MRSIIGHFKAIPDYRARIGTYPLWSLLAIVFLAHLCGAPRRQKDLEKFAAGLNDGQRRALGIRRRHGKYPTPRQPTFCRLMAGVKSEELEKSSQDINRLCPSGFRRPLRKAPTGSEEPPRKEGNSQVAQRHVKPGHA